MACPPALAGGFRVGAAVRDFTPPRFGRLADDPADCLRGPAQQALYDGSRRFAFEEPYADEQHTGHYDAGDPYLDCNANERWDGNFLGGGADTPRFYDHVADHVGARAMVVSNGHRTIAVEVLDNEGAFNVYLQRIRERVAADGFDLDGIFISSNHDESAPDTIGISGVDQTTSSVNDYFVDHLVARSAQAIEAAYRRMEPATIRYAEAIEPADLRQCWSSYPYTDDQLMPSLQATGSHGHTIVTLANVSQHDETLGFNPDPVQRRWVSGDWLHFFRTALEGRYGGVGIEMAGSVGSVETDEVFDHRISRVPERFVDEDHPAGCRTLFKARDKPLKTGYREESRRWGEQMAGAVAHALDHHGRRSRSQAIWGERADICVPLTNALFEAAAAAGVFAHRPGYSANCTVAVPPARNGSTSGNEVRSQVAAFGIGDGEFASVPGEVFPFTYLRGFQGPQDMPFPQYPLAPWLIPHMHAPFRFIDGLAEDMIGYIFPRGNGVGVPGERADNPTGEGTDRFGCGHSDDGEAASSQTADIAGAALVDLLDAHGGRAEEIRRGRYMLSDGRVSRDPLGGPEIKCDVDRRFSPARAVGVRLASGRKVEPGAWMSLSGRRQGHPDRNTRGYFTRDGKRVWLEVFDPIDRSRRSG